MASRFFLKLDHDEIYTWNQIFDSGSSQIDSAIKISELVQLLQQERSAVAIYNFHSGTANVNNAKSLQRYVENGVNISHYTMDAVRYQFL